ncbi:MAG TPA: class I SAM-dependent methyltransferase [Mycobacteriales bacterium]|nr:class I SAM-dependent methyltransferase [Mycobacteriales bacterium]
MSADPAPGLRHRWHRVGDYDELTRRVQRRNAELVARLHPEPGPVRSAYEIGCGTGNLTAALVRALPAARIDAVDVSAPMLAEPARKPWPQRVRFARAAFPDVPVRRRYEAVFSNAALHWMHADYPRVFATIAALLVPGGVACLAVAARTAGTDAFEADLAARLPAAVPRAGLESFARSRRTADEVAGLAEAAGLAVADAFVVERRAVLPAGAYARWWVASGGPWAGGDGPRDPAGVIAAGLGGPDAPVELVHASVLAVLQRPEPG